MQRRQWHPTPVLLPGKSHGWRRLVGCSPWGRYESDTTERLHFHFSLSCIAEGNGNPFQCSCLENPRDGGTWWAATCVVAQSRTRLKQLSSSSSSSSSLELSSGINKSHLVPSTSHQDPPSLSSRVKNSADIRTNLEKAGWLAYFLYFLDIHVWSLLRLPDQYCSTETRRLELRQNMFNTHPLFLPQDSLP